MLFSAGRAYSLLQKHGGAVLVRALRYGAEDPTSFCIGLPALRLKVQTWNMYELS